MEPKFTPGPWKIAGDASKLIGSVFGELGIFETDYVITKADVFETAGYIALVNSAQTFADAKLIAAAPDLYAALESLLKERNYYAERLANATGITMSDHDGREHAIFALKKARGE